MQQVTDWFTLNINEGNQSQKFLGEAWDFWVLTAPNPHDFEDIFSKSDFEKNSTNGKSIMLGICPCPSPFSSGFHCKNWHILFGKRRVLSKVHEMFANNEFLSTGRRSQVEINSSHQTYKEIRQQIIINP